MIQLQNVSKTYISETKQEVHALKDVSFELGSRGMVFILGKSGSGKSTLLNLLGGLDKPSMGDVTVDGVSMRDFTSTDYEAYRNGYVGFIFQEYNLLEDFNVRENISLALHLMKGDDIEEKVVEALHQVELDEEYLTRRVDEMSGGEKQRIAIARAIVKDSRVILADEPTGNLDSMTGESVWNILKNISQSKLVVVVSHDRDSAEQYADRIIEIADGCVVSDSGVQPAEETKTQFTPQKKSLSLKACLRLAFNSIKQRKIRSASVAVISILCILALLVVQICLTFSAEQTMARLIKNNDVPYITVAQGSKSDSVTVKDINDLQDFFLRLQHNGKINPDTLQYVDDNANFILDRIVSDKQQVEDFGLTFVGEAFELDEYSFYITKHEIDRRLSNGNRIDFYAYYDEYGYGFVDYINQENGNIEDLVGKEVSLNSFNLGYYSGAYAKLAGIIDTDAIPVVSREYIPVMFARKDFVYWGRNHDLRLGQNSKVAFGDDVLERIGFNAYSACAYSSTYLLANVNSDGEKQTYVTANTTLPLAYDEIVLSAGLFVALLDKTGASISDYVDVRTGTVKNIPEILGETIPIRLYNYKTGELEADLGEFRVAGISTATSFDVVFSTAKMTDLYLQFSESVPILIQTDSVKNMTKFLTTLRNDYDGYVSGAGMFDGKLYVGIDDVGPREISQDIYMFEKSLVLTTIFVGGIGVMMLIVLVLLVINLISFSIVDRTKEIGVLTALGTSNRDLTKIFLLETLLISVIVFVLSLVGASCAAHYFNADYFSLYVDYISLLHADILTVAIAFVASIGFLTLAALIPLRKIGKLNPVDAIRNN